MPSLFRMMQLFFFAYVANRLSNLRLAMWTKVFRHKKSISIAELFKSCQLFKFI